MTDIVETACECGTRLSAPNEDAFPDVFLAHVRSVHADWPYADEGVRTVGAAMLRLTGPTEWLPEIGEVVIQPVSADRIDDWASFFDHDAFVDRPWLASCYCLEPYTRRGEAPSQGQWRERRAQMLELFERGEAFGYLAYVDGRPVGWVNASKRSEQALYRLGEEADPADDTIAAVSCFVIAPPYRRHGLAGRLLDAVVSDAPNRGVEWIEAYPFHDGVAESEGTNFHGPLSLFEARGFEALRKLTYYTVMRRAVPPA